MLRTEFAQRDYYQGSPHKSFSLLWFGW